MQINETKRVECWRCEEHIELGDAYCLVGLPNRPEHPTCLGCVAQLVSRQVTSE